MRCIHTVILSAATILPGTVHADGSHAAVVTRLKGTAALFLKAAPASGVETNVVTFEGQTYHEVPLKQGARLGNGDVLQTGTDTQVRLIFRNGDSLSVGPSTSYEVSWEKDSGPPIFKVFYGKVRAIFKKDGPRTGSVVRTKTTAMGVRGTDFHVGVAGGTTVSVLRGEVTLKSTRPGAKEVALQTGFTAKVEEPKPVPAPKANAAKDQSTPAPTELAAEEIIVAPTTKSELIEIQKKSVVKVVEVASPGESADSGREKELAELEKLSAQTVLTDIKATDPILFDKIAANKKAIDDPDAINTLSVGELFKKAPATPGSDKPSAKELEGLGNDAYDKYFKVD
jgi:hypothetical protein